MNRPLVAALALITVIVLALAGRVCWATWRISAVTNALENLVRELRGAASEEDLQRRVAELDIPAAYRWLRKDGNRICDLWGQPVQLALTATIGTCSLEARSTGEDGVAGNGDDLAYGITYTVEPGATGP